MAKTAGKSKARVGAAGKAKRPTKDSKAPARMQARHADDEDHVDGCDFEFHDSEATPDLGCRRRKAAWKSPEERADEDHVNRCDVDFDDMTTDEDLPAAVGRRKWLFH